MGDLSELSISRRVVQLGDGGRDDARRAPSSITRALLSGALLSATCLLAGIVCAAPARAASPRASDAALQRAIARLFAKPDGPPGVAVVVQRGRRVAFHTAGVADVRRKQPIEPTDHMRLASVAKAFSGAVALSLVAERKLSLSDTVGKWLPSLPAAWSAVTLRELLAPAPEALLAFAAPRLQFAPGSRYHYSNSDNVIVALIAAAAGRSSYESELSQRVLAPLRLSSTSLPSDARLPRPFVHAYVVDPPNAPEDVSELFAAGWSWASGGVVSTPRDANSFVRAYVRGALTNRSTRAAQFTFVPGSSEPTGPGVNSAGLAIFRYRTRCGTVYGHTGNTAGFTQLIAANASGTRSTVVSVNAQITPKSNAKRFSELRAIYTLAVCSALA